MEVSSLCPDMVVGDELVKFGVLIAFQDTSGAGPIKNPGGLLVLSSRAVLLMGPSFMGPLSAYSMRSLCDRIWDDVFLVGMLAAGGSILGASGVRNLSSEVVCNSEVFCRQVGKDPTKPK